MYKKVLFYLLGLLMILILIISIAENHLISDCPKFLLNDLKFEICQKFQSDEDDVNLTITDTIYKNREYILLFDPIFAADYDTTKKWLNLCIGAEEISYDSILKIDLFVIKESHKYNISKSINQLNSNTKYSINGEEVDSNGNSLSFKNMYNELNNGYGDFYHSLFELWAFDFKFTKNTPLKGEITFLMTINFTNGRTIRFMKNYILKN